MNYGEKFKELRIKAGYSRNRLAIKADVSFCVIKALEDGKSGTSLHNAVKLVKALNISLDELVGLK